MLYIVYKTFIIIIIINLFTYDVVYKIYESCLKNVYLFNNIHYLLYILYYMTFEYLSGFGNDFQSETKQGSLPIGKFIKKQFINYIQVKITLKF